MAHATRQLASFEMAVRELIPGREYPLDRVMALCRAKDHRFGYSTLCYYLRGAVSSGVLVRVGGGVYAARDAQGGAIQRLPILEPLDPAADLSQRLVHIEDGVLVCTQQQALLDQKLDHVLTLLRQLLPPSKEV